VRFQATIEVQGQVGTKKRLRFGLGRQALAAFGTTGVNHGAAACGFHAGTKAMRALTTDDRGLESTFHISCSSIYLWRRGGGLRFHFQIAAQMKERRVDLASKDRRRKIANPLF
jgi:hypothetical protein